MVQYKCKCIYKTDLRANMRRHILRKKCIEYLGDINELIDTLCIERIKKYADLSNVSIEEKKQRFKEYKKQHGKIRNLKIGALGQYNELDLSKKIYKSMKWDSKYRGHEQPEITFEEFTKLLLESRYKIDTSIGILEFPMKLTNGYFNSASPDRIDNNKGYLRSNIRIVPCFLNVNDKLLSKIEPEDWKKIVIIREQKRNINKLIKIANDLLNNSISNSHFYQLGNSAHLHSKKSNGKKTFEFEYISDFIIYIIEQFIKQGGRCAYLKIPIYPESGHKYKVSLERINPLNGYTKDNIVLITSALNGNPVGQRRHLTYEQRNEIIKYSALGYNIDKLDEWTLVDLNRRKKIEELIEFEKCILESLIDMDKIKSKIKIRKSVII